MSAPLTLRAIEGLPGDPPPLKNAALVLIDCQNTYRQGTLALTGVEAALDEAARLLDTARLLKIPVFHIQHDAGVGSLFDIRSEIGAIADKVRPRDGEPVIVKNYPNSFIATDLEKQLSATGTKDVLLAGFMTHMCVNSTARGAFNLGFRPTVIARATATRDLPDAKGQRVSAQVLQEASLAMLGDLFAVVVESVDALQS